MTTAAPRVPRVAPGSPDERGSGSVLMLGVTLVVVALAYTAVLVAGYQVALHRARAAADLAALTAASAVAEGADGCEAARRNATRHGARVTACDRVGDQIDYVVSVTAFVEVRMRVPGLPRAVGATAHAGSDSRA